MILYIPDSCFTIGVADQQKPTGKSFVCWFVCACVCLFFFTDK